MKDQHYSMKDPEDWTDQDMDMYKRDESRIEPEPSVYPYTDEQVRRIEDELDYEQHMKDTKQ